jgi:hypothetical protein
LRPSRSQLAVGLSATSRRASLTYGRYRVADGLLSMKAAQGGTADLARLLWEAEGMKLPAVGGLDADTLGVIDDVVVCKDKPSGDIKNPDPCARTSRDRPPNSFHC